MGTKTECRRADRLHPWTIEAVELPVTIRHRTDVGEDAVVRNLPRVDRTDDLVHPTETRIGTGTEIGRGNILGETGRDPDHEEGLVLETEDVVVVVTEAEIGTEAEKAVDTTGHPRTNRILLKTLPKQL